MAFQYAAKAGPAGGFGLILLDGTVPLLGEDGVTMIAGAYRPTEACDGGIAEKLGIPAAYLRRMRTTRRRRTCSRPCRTSTN